MGMAAGDYTMRTYLTHMSFFFFSFFFLDKRIFRCIQGKEATAYATTLTSLKLSAKTLLRTTSILSSPLTSAFQILLLVPPLRRWNG